jgi:Flp pilus assembly protein CpaB
MNRRILLIVLLVAVLGVGAVVLLPMLTQQPPPPTADPSVDGGTAVAPGSTPLPTATPLVLSEVVVAVQQLPRGIKIPEGALAIRLWPASAVPQRAMTRVADVAGRIARTDIFVEQPIVDTVLVEDLGQISAKGSDAAAVIPRGKVAISIPVDRLTDVAYAPHDGDYVDIIVSFLFIDVDPNFQTQKPNSLTLTSIAADGTIQLQTGIQGELQANNFSQFPVVAGPSEKQRPRLVTQRTVQAAWVVHSGTFPLDGQFLRPVATPLPTPTPAEGEPTKAAPPPTPVPPFPDILTVAVDPQEAVTIAWIIESRIPMTLVLRSAQGDPTAKGDLTATVSLQYMIETYQITVPPGLPYALEPALRSIRSLFVGNAISLQDAK